MNTISIGQYGSFNIITVNTTSIMCLLMDAPCGRHAVEVNVAGKGFASKNGTLRVEIPLSIRSFDPHSGVAGGGYPLIIYGMGFSSATVITIDGNPCTNSSQTNFSCITYTVSASRLPSTGRVVVSAIDNTYSSNVSYLLTTPPTFQAFSKSNPE